MLTLALWQAQDLPQRSQERRQTAQNISREVQRWQRLAEKQYYPLTGHYFLWSRRSPTSRRQEGPLTVIANEALYPRVIRYGDEKLLLVTDFVLVAAADRRAFEDRLVELECVYHQELPFDLIHADAVLALFQRDAAP